VLWQLFTMPFDRFQAGLRTTLAPSLTAISHCIPLCWHQWASIRVQIRTLEMHHVAEYGIAAHWKYKETGSSNHPVNRANDKFTWLRQLLEWQNDLKDAQEYLESIKDNLFEDDVYVFTPKEMCSA